MDAPVYIAFLVGVGRNSARFATFTGWTRHTDDQLECRAPSILPADKINERFYEIDRAAKMISNWEDLYSWLGRDVGTWGAFTQKAALDLVPHWFSESVEFICESVNSTGNGPYLDVSCPPLSESELARFNDLTGSVESRDGQIFTHQAWSNLVVTMLPIFLDLEPQSDRTNR